MKDKMHNTINFAGYSFPSNKACLVCEHVTAHSREPKFIAHDEDGWIQVLCDIEKHNRLRAKTIGLAHIIQRLPTETDLPLLKPGYYAHQLDTGIWMVVEM